MSQFILEDGTFGFSGQPSRLEHYKCFHDPSNAEWIKGDELLELENSPMWSEEKADVWHFFYRPYNYGKNIAPAQKQDIETLEIQIKKAKKDLFLNKIFLIIAVILIISSSYFLYQRDVHDFLIFPAIYTLYLLIKNHDLKKKIIQKELETSILSREIDFLMGQKKNIEDNRLRPYEVEALFWKKVCVFEDKYINKTFSKSVDSVKMESPNFYNHPSLRDFGNHEFPTFPVIPSWGFLQSSVRSSGSGDIQVTGLQIIADSLFSKERVATWRKGFKGRPIFRVWYIQFLIFHEENLELVSYYYDFVTDKTYSEAIEAYQYNHITNYTYADEDISYMCNDPLILGMSNIPSKLTSNIFGNQVKTISLNSASGSNYRCVIPDKDVTDGIDLWLAYNAEQKAIKEALTSATECEAEEWIDELLDSQQDYEGLIETLAWLCFKQIREKASQAKRFEKIVN